MSGIPNDLNYIKYKIFISYEHCKRLFDRRLLNLSFEYWVPCVKVY